MTDGGVDVSGQAVELALDGELRKTNIERNSELIDKAGGLLAPINGAERYLTLGCGHTVAFCKTAQVHGDTSAPELMCQGSTKIDVQKICESKDFDTMIHVGWDWEIVPSCVDEAFDGFSKIAQKALNTQNHANTPISEMEVMMTMEAMMSDPFFDKEIAIDNIKCMGAPSASYSNCLYDFVSVYGGAPGPNGVDRLTDR